MLVRFVTFCRGLFLALIGTALKFGVIGLVCYVIDVGIFNALRLGAAGDGHFFQGPIGAKIVSVAIATLASWCGNRFWTFRHDRRTNFLLELVEFTVVAIVGLGIQLACIGVSHYVLGFTSLLADNISGNVVGLVFGTAFRFLAYRYWVYGEHRSDGRRALDREAAAAPDATQTDTTPAAAASAN